MLLTFKIINEKKPNEYYTFFLWQLWLYTSYVWLYYSSKNVINLTLDISIYLLYMCMCVCIKLLCWVIVVKKMIHILLFVLYLLNTHATYKVDENPSILKGDLELERKLELINKPPIKSIHVCLNFMIFHDMLPLVDITLHRLIISFVLLYFESDRQRSDTLLIALTFWNNHHLTILY